MKREADHRVEAREVGQMTVNGTRLREALLESALHYARGGWLVFPVHGVRDGRCTCGVAKCSNAAKHPQTPHGLHDATGEEATIRGWWARWPDANIGIRTGAESGLVVLDVDPKAGGDETLVLLEVEHGRLPDTPEVLTGGGGRHLYFAHPGGAFANTAGRLGPGLDTRGDGGYVVAPPSLHAGGRAYEWEVTRHADEIRLAAMPQWLLVRLRAGTDGAGRVAEPLPDVIPEGQRDAMLTSLAGTMRRRGCGVAAVLAALRVENTDRCEPPLADVQLEKIAGSVGRYAPADETRPADLARLSRDGDPSATVEYLESLAQFLAEADPPANVIFPDLLPSGVIMLLHGEPRSRKSLAAFELALSAATGTAPFGLTRFTPPAPIDVLYVQEEDPRPLTRPRLRKLVEARCGDLPPATLHVAVRRGVNLDDPAWVARLIADLQRLGVKLLVLDAARRLSSRTDEGPSKVRELIGVLRSIVIEGGVTIVIVHHDVKPQRDGQDLRRRSQRASGGDWFAGCECPVHLERLTERESLVFPEDYKFSGDPAPFTFACDVEDGLIARLVGTDTTSERAERAGVRGKILDWLRGNGPATKTDMKRAGLARWDAIEDALEGLEKEGRVDAGPGRKAGSLRYFVSEGVSWR